MLGRPDPVREWADRLFSYGPGARTDLDSLIVIYARDDALVGRRYTLNPDGATIGRSADNTLVLDGEGTSRRHARLERRGDGWWVIDAGSTNGTAINDEQVQEARLGDGDRLRIGFTILKFFGGRARR